MYCPESFQEQRPEVLHRLMAEHPLATVVRPSAEGLVADHLPLLHLPSPDGPGHLIGHVARANPLWQSSPHDELLLIFQGPQAYISPNWYATKADGGRVVPTWNYAVLHVHARMTAIDEPEALMGILEQLTQRHEAEQPHPWHVSDAPAEFTHKLLDHIVGVRFEILRMQGKFKTSQNQPGINRTSVAAGLRSSGRQQDQEMSELIHRLDHPR